ncbi:hypothetical protein AR456_15680 [Halomonas huangheensis]|nr:hypothetical protein AR456_15680 [Halomonas huangheensis]
MRKLFQAPLFQAPLLLAMTLSASVAAHAETITVAAASSLQFAMPELVERFEAEHDDDVRVTFGASGNLLRQIQQGAPFEIFLSADEARARTLEQQGLSDGEGLTYALGRLVWLQSKEHPLPDEGDPLQAVRQAIAQAQKSGTRQRFALANPEHAPYGMAAREVLEREGLWQDSQDLRIVGENVAQAAQFSLSAEAIGGFSAYSLVTAPELEERAAWRLIPEQWHAPLVQRMVLVKDAGEGARSFFDFMQSPEAGEILNRFGFSIPDTP